MEQRRITDLRAGAAIATGMVVVFVAISPGNALICTFVPGVLFTLLNYIALLFRDRPVPQPSRFLPLFFVILAVQTLHFVEELVTGFRWRFPMLYGGDPFTGELFVSFNIATYVIVSVAAVVVVTRRVRPLLMPVLFLAIYGSLGNAIGHLYWSIHTGAYFPGLYTSLAGWVLGPLFLVRLHDDRRLGLGLALGFVLIQPIVLALGLR